MPNLAPDVRGALIVGLIAVFLAAAGLGWYASVPTQGKAKIPKPAAMVHRQERMAAAPTPPGPPTVDQIVYQGPISFPIVPPGYVKGAVSAANRPPASGIRGIFLTGAVAGSGRLPQLIAQLKAAGMNAVVINVKDDSGHLTWNMNFPGEPAGAASSQISDVHALLKTLKENGIYAIGRIVTFKDPVEAAAHPDRAVQLPGGGLWQDNMGEAWLDPYNQANWQYAVAVAKQAAAAGFQEIQFDYVRFPSDGNLSDLVYPARTAEPSAEVISDFLRYADRQLAPYGVEVGADVFGLVTVAQDDLGIGQELLPVSGAVDIISPMTYPSLYADGSFGLANPALDPYTTVYRSLSIARARLAGGPAVDMVPWIQDFSLWGVSYGAAQVQLQVKAIRDAGYDQWMLWNPACVYDIP